MTPGTRALALLALAPLGALASGCERKAPGPEECHAAAVRWVAAELGPSRAAVTEGVLRALEQRVLERATVCLTAPYDRELVRCVSDGAPPRSCLRKFEARKSQNL